MAGRIWVDEHGVEWIDRSYRRTRGMPRLLPGAFTTMPDPDTWMQTDDRVASRRGWLHAACKVVWSRDTGGVWRRKTTIEALRDLAPEVSSRDHFRDACTNITKVAHAVGARHIEKSSRLFTYEDIVGDLALLAVDADEFIPADQITARKDVMPWAIGPTYSGMQKRTDVPGWEQLGSDVLDELRRGGAPDELQDAWRAGLACASKYAEGRARSSGPAEKLLNRLADDLSDNEADVVALLGWILMSDGAFRGHARSAGPRHAPRFSHNGKTDLIVSGWRALEVQNEALVEIKPRATWFVTCHPPKRAEDFDALVCWEDDRGPTCRRSDYPAQVLSLREYLLRDPGRWNRLLDAAERRWVA